MLVPEDNLWTVNTTRAGKSPKHLTPAELKWSDMDYEGASDEQTPEKIAERINHIFHQSNTPYRAYWMGRLHEERERYRILARERKSIYQTLRNEYDITHHGRQYNKFVRECSDQHGDMTTNRIIMELNYDTPEKTGDITNAILHADYSTYPEVVYYRKYWFDQEFPDGHTHVVDDDTSCIVRPQQ